MFRSAWVRNWWLYLPKGETIKQKHFGSASSRWAPSSNPKTPLYCLQRHSSEEAAIVGNSIRASLVGWISGLLCRGHTFWHLNNNNSDHSMEGYARTFLFLLKTESNSGMPARTPHCSSVQWLGVCSPTGSKSLSKKAWSSARHVTEFYLLQPEA